MTFQLNNHCRQPPLASLLPGLLLTLFYALALRLSMEWLLQSKPDWPPIALEPALPAYGEAAVRWRVRLDLVFCTGLALWMGWRYWGGSTWRNVLALLAASVGLPLLILLISERADIAIDIWALFWLPLQLMAIMLLGQGLGWLSAWGWRRLHTQSHRMVLAAGKTRISTYPAQPQHWPAIGEALLRQARQDAKTYAADVNMSQARRGLHSGIIDVERILQDLADEQAGPGSLLLLQQRLTAQKNRYLSLPGDEGAWECGVLSQAIEMVEYWLAHCGE